jgi:light-regulated signal transduction histidine kinase (bacteriophytochrome)
MSEERGSNTSQEAAVWKRRYERERQRRQMTEQLAESITRDLYDAKVSNVELIRLNTELEQFTNFAAHDFREPLRRIESVCSFLGPSLYENADQHDHGMVDILVKSVTRMRTLVDAFHDLTSVSRPSLEYSTTSLRELVTRCLEHLPEISNKRSAIIEIDQLPTLPVYPSLIEQLYINILQNALKYSSKDEILIRCTHDKTDGEPSVLGVLNTGSTIHHDHLEAIFSPFKRFDNKREGSGLGLFICKKIVERHQGRIWATSAEDRVHIKFTLEPQSNGR